MSSGTIRKQLALISLLAFVVWPWATLPVRAASAPLAISQVTANPTRTSVTITWLTNQPATSQILWGPGDTLGDKTTVNTALVLNHSQTIPNVIPGQTYYYRAVSQTAAGSYARSDDTTFTTLPPDPNAPYNYSLKLTGPQKVVAGHTLYLAIEARILAGPTNGHLYFKSLTGLPANTAVTFLTSLTDDNACCLDSQTHERYAWVLSDAKAIKITTPASTPLGNYPITLTTESNSVTRQAQATIIVAPVERLSRQPITTVPAIPGLAAWQQNMLTYGQQWCQTSQPLDTWEGRVWYYDGTRVYNQIADYTNDSDWQQCADWVNHFLSGRVCSTKQWPASWSSGFLAGLSHGLS